MTLIIYLYTFNILNPFESALLILEDINKAGAKALQTTTLFPDYEGLIIDISFMIVLFQNDVISSCNIVREYI